MLGRFSPLRRKQLLQSLTQRCAEIPQVRVSGLYVVAGRYKPVVYRDHCGHTGQRKTRNADWWALALAGNVGGGEAGTRRNGDPSTFLQGPPINTAGLVRVHFTPLRLTVPPVRRERPYALSFMKSGYRSQNPISY